MRVSVTAAADDLAGGKGGGRDAKPALRVGSGDAIFHEGTDSKTRSWISRLRISATGRAQLRGGFLKLPAVNGMFDLCETIYFTFAFT